VGKSEGPVGILTRSEQMAWTIARCSEIGTGTFLLKLRIACGVELRSTDSRGRLSPQKARLSYMS
jgi:hypothetical protein